MVMVRTGPYLRTEDIIAGTIDAADIAADAVGTAKIAAGRVQASHFAADTIGTANINANGIKGSHLSTTALSQVIRTTGPAAGPVESVPGGTGTYSANLTGFNARFAWAKITSSDRFAKIFTILAGGSGVQIIVRSANDAGGASARLVPNVSNSIQVCWVL